MLTITAAVLLTITATVTPISISPTARPTMTVGEQKLFNELVKCGSMADKDRGEAYEAGMKDGIRYQHCFSLCNMLQSSKEALRKYKLDFIKTKNSEGLEAKVFGGEKDDVRWYEDSVAKDQSLVDKDGCDCSEYKYKEK